MFQPRAITFFMSIAVFVLTAGSSGKGFCLDQELKTAQESALNPKTRIPLTNVQAATTTKTRTAEFHIQWPLMGPADGTPDPKDTLLAGRIAVRHAGLESDNPRLILNFTLTRLHDETHRVNWNKTLMYREYAWMARLRVWDKENKWIFPNLTYLLKLHGADREGRYGGWDMGHADDNDFAAVLIRKYDPATGQELPDTSAAPLVSAVWHSVGIKKEDKQTLVHASKSDDFTISLSAGKPPHAGAVKVWLIYADFMEHPPPDGWPEESELKGGTLACYQVEWRYERGKPLELTVQPEIPPEHTGFDWENWVGRKDKAGKPIGKSRLK